MLTEDERRRRFEELFDRYYWEVRAYVLRRGPASSAEDVVAETFLVAWRRLESIDADALPWLLGVARRTLVQSASRRTSSTRFDRAFDDALARVCPGLGSAGADERADGGGNRGVVGARA